jgi:hypothetical protein
MTSENSDMNNRVKVALVLHYLDQTIGVMKSFMINNQSLKQSNMKQVSNASITKTIVIGLLRNWSQQHNCSNQSRKIDQLMNTYSQYEHLRFCSGSGAWENHL